MGAMGAGSVGLRGPSSVGSQKPPAPKGRTRKALGEAPANRVNAQNKKGGVAKPVLSEKFMREAYNLTAFFSGNKVLQNCLEKVQSSSVLARLQEAAAKGAATLRGAGAEQALETEVAAVYKPLEEALRLADKDGKDLKRLQLYCPGGELSMKDLCANSREYLILILAYSMQFISEAAAGALEKGGATSKAA